MSCRAADIIAGLDYVNATAIRIQRRLNGAGTSGEPVTVAAALQHENNGYAMLVDKSLHGLVNVSGRLYGENLKRSYIHVTFRDPQCSDSGHYVCNISYWRIFDHYSKADSKYVAIRSK